MGGPYTRAQLVEASKTKLQLQAAEEQAETQRSALARIDEQLRELQAKRACAASYEDAAGDAAGLVDYWDRELAGALMRRAEVERMLEANFRFVKRARALLDG